MSKFFLSIFISLLFFGQTFAKDVSIDEDIDLEFVCELEKKIIKNSEYNYQTFLANDLNEKGLDKFEKNNRDNNIKKNILFLFKKKSINIL